MLNPWEKQTSEMRWQTRTIRDCPGNRTEVEWRTAVLLLQEKLQGSPRRCSKCGQEIASNSFRYHVTETSSWLPSMAGLPRDRWGVSAHARTLSGARELRDFMGKRATIWVKCKRQPKNGGTTYRRYK